MLNSYLNPNSGIAGHQLKVKKVKLDPEIMKRKLLLEKYQETLKKYKLKLEEEKNKKKKL